MNIRRKIFLILMFLWMAGIFAFSSRTGGESTQDSYFVGHLAGKIFVPGFEEWSADRQEAFAQAIDHPVRKTAHAAEYAVLGALAAGVWIDGKKKSAKREIFFPWLTAAVYAAGDEIHQLFVPGRSGQFSDVLLDSAGAAAGVLLIAFLRYIAGKYFIMLQKNRRII